jgi:hypothetical protein
MTGDADAKPSAIPQSQQGWHGGPIRHALFGDETARQWPGTGLAPLTLEVDRMRSAQTILGLVTSAFLTVTPVSAHSNSRPPAAPPHAQAPKPPSKPMVTGPRTTLNPIALKISSHPQLASKVTSLLPSGMTLNRASKGFKNQGQFIAALHVSRNLGIPFSTLKADMTGAKHLSLGQSIQDLKPTAKPTTEAHHAEAEADDDVKTTATTPKSPTTKTAKKPATTTAASTTLNPIARKITSHPQLAAKVHALLPAGLTLNQASKGFKNQGQFLAALHASKDLNIPFAQLKAEMTGKDHDSLGAAIQELKPGADARTAARSAENDADADVKTTAPAPTSHTGDKDRDDQ